MIFNMTVITLYFTEKYYSFTARSWDLKVRPGSRLGSHNLEGLPQFGVRDRLLMGGASDDASRDNVGSVLGRPPQHWSNVVPILYPGSDCSQLIWGHPQCWLICMACWARFRQANRSGSGGRGRRASQMPLGQLARPSAAAMNTERPPSVPGRTGSGVL